MNENRRRVLLLAENANPDWVSVPLVGWSHVESLMRRVDGHLVTQTRNQSAIEKAAGWREGSEFTTIDTEIVAKPMWAFDVWLRKLTGLGWTTSTALSSLPYYLFEQRVWQKFGERILRREFDIVHRVTPLSPTIPSTIAGRCKRAGVPFIWGPINGGVPWPPGYSDVVRGEGDWLSYARSAHRLLPGYRSTRRNASATIVGSRDTWKELSRYHDRCVYIPENAVDPARFHSVAEPDDTGPLRAVFIGRLVPYKGADMLIQAALPLVRAGKLEVDILGDGQQMPELRQLVEKEGVAAGVHLRGWVEHTALHEHMRRAHVLAFPSIREFGGGVVLEAMMMGIVPVIVDYAGPAELITPSTGFSVPIGRRCELVAAFTQILGEICEDRSKLRKMGAQGRKRVLDLFTWDAKARQVGEVYEWVLGAGPKPDFGMPFRDLD